MTISGSRFRKCVTVTSRPVEEIDQACDLFMGGLLFLRVLQTVVRQHRWCCASIDMTLG